MAIVADQFERVADAIAERTAEILGAQAAVLDDRRSVVASTETALVGLPFDSFRSVSTDRCLHVPLRFHGRSGEIVVAQPADGEIPSPHLAQLLIELIVNQTAVVERLPNQHELKYKFIHDLLHGSFADEATIFREAQILGMDLVPPRVVILIDASEYILGHSDPDRSENMDPGERRRSQHVIGSVVDFFELPNDTICAYIGNGEVAVLKASNRKNLGTWVQGDSHAESLGSSWANLSAVKRAGLALLTRLRADTGVAISVGIGRHHPGLGGLARSYGDARAALSLGRRFRGSNQVHCLDGLGIAAFVGVSDAHTKLDLATYLLSPLDHEPELIETLQSFFAHDCSPSETADELAIHRNTLSYRLDKIASLTGLDPRRFDDAVQIRLALVLRSLGPGEDLHASGSAAPGR